MTFQDKEILLGWRKIGETTKLLGWSKIEITGITKIIQIIITEKLRFIDGMNKLLKLRFYISSLFFFFFLIIKFLLIDRSPVIQKNIQR